MSDCSSAAHARYGSATVPEKMIGYWERLYIRCPRGSALMWQGSRSCRPSLLRALDDRSAAPPAIIAAWLANHVNKFAEIHRFVKIALDFRGAHEADPDIAATIESFYVKERKLLSRVIRQGIRKGVFKPVDPNRMAQFISTYLDGCMVRSVILPDFDLKGAVRDLHQRVLEMLGYTGKTRTLQPR